MKKSRIKSPDRSMPLDINWPPALSKVVRCITVPVFASIVLFFITAAVVWRCDDNNKPT